MLSPILRRKLVSLSILERYSALLTIKVQYALQKQILSVISRLCNMAFFAQHSSRPLIDDDSLSKNVII